MSAFGDHLSGTMDQLDAHSAELAEGAVNIRGVIRAIDKLEERKVGAGDVEGQKALQEYVGAARRVKAEAGELVRVCSEF